MTQQPNQTLQAPDADAASREEALTDLFVTLADTLVAEFDVVELLDRLVDTCLGLFKVTAAAVLVLDTKNALRLVASSNKRAEELEIFQIQVDEGPCLDCARSLTPVLVPDLSADRDRWPHFSAAADIVGFKAVHAVPLRLRSQGIGGFGLFHSTPTQMSSGDVHAVQALADVATIGILQQQHAQQAVSLSDQLQGALNSRIAVEQAKGVIAESGNVEMDVAFDQLRRYSRDNNLKISRVAQAIATRELSPVTIIRHAQDRR